MEVKKSPKIPKKMGCEDCHYYTSNKKDYDKHLLTCKHKKNEEGSIQEDEKSQLYNCLCGKLCKTHGGIWKHKQKCQMFIYESDKNNIDIMDSNIIIHLIKQNDEFKNILIEQGKTLIEQNKTIVELSKNNIINNNSNNTNSHNKTFNLQFFLNETCKDAMNIMEFIDSIKLQLSDLENVGQVGYVEGISNIIVKNLNALDINKRPVHCTDKKREVMYVKDENKWEKENDDKKKIRKMIKYIASKNQRMLPKFKEAHPDCSKSISRFSDKYNKILVESMGGSGDNDLEKEDKIIRNISKNILVNKEP